MDDIIICQTPDERHRVMIDFLCIQRNAIYANYANEDM